MKIANLKNSIFFFFFFFFFLWWEFGTDPRFEVRKVGSDPRADIYEWMEKDIRVHGKKVRRGFVRKK